MLDKKKNMKGLTNYLYVLGLPLRKATKALNSTASVFYVLKRINDIWFLQERSIYPLIGTSSVYSYKYLRARKDSLISHRLGFSKERVASIEVQAVNALRMKDQNKVSNRM